MNELTQKIFEVLSLQITQLTAEQKINNRLLEKLIETQEEILSALQNIENNTKPETF